MTNSAAAYEHFAGNESLDVLLKPACLDVRLQIIRWEARGVSVAQISISQIHSIIRWLPSKLAAWIGENFGQVLQIPPKRDLEWTTGELNAILENNLVPSRGGQEQLLTFGCIQ